MFHADCWGMLIAYCIQFSTEHTQCTFFIKIIINFSHNLPSLRSAVTNSCWPVTRTARAVRLNLAVN